MEEIKDILKTNQEGPKKQPFEVPAGYFETFEDRMEAQINALDEKPDMRRTIVRILKPIAGLAASFLLIMLLVKYPLSHLNTVFTAQNQSSQVDEDDYWQELFLTNSSFLDDQKLVQSITAADNESSPAHSEEIISIISTEMNDYEIIAELSN